MTPYPLRTVRGDDTVRLVPCPACVGDDDACITCGGLRRVPVPFGEDLPLVAGGQGHSAQQVVDDASGVLVVWALGAVVFVVACVVAGGLQ